jgi:hypothetical protein
MDESLKDIISCAYESGRLSDAIKAMKERRIIVKEVKTSWQDLQAAVANAEGEIERQKTAVNKLINRIINSCPSEAIMLNCEDAHKKCKNECLICWIEYAYATEEEAKP